MVPGSRAMLEALRRRGVRCYLASGTDEPYVLDEAAALGVTPYFAGIYGAQDDYKRFSKKLLIDRIIAEHGLSGPEFVAFGDGFVEIEDTVRVGGIAVGVATNEAERAGIDEWKRNRLIEAGADMIVPDFREHAGWWRIYSMKCLRTGCYVKRALIDRCTYPQCTHHGSQFYGAIPCPIPFRPLPPAPQAAGGAHPRHDAGRGAAAGCAGPAVATIRTCRRSPSASSGRARSARR